jgi:hypothetical protein
MMRWQSRGASVLDRPEVQAMRQERGPRALVRMFAGDYVAKLLAHRTTLLPPA